MFKPANRIVMVVAILLSVLSASPLSAQERKLVYENWYGETKKELTAHYTGKTVKLRMAIPYTRRGLEMTDGTFQSNDSAEPQAQPGDDVTIRSFKVGVSNIELVLNKTSGKRPNRFFGWMKPPRINLRFSRELTAKDMTVESINQWLAQAIDVAPLIAVTAEKSPNTASPLLASMATPMLKPLPPDAPQDLPTATVTGELAPANPNFGELTVEASAGGARIYIDGAYSGVAPRTVRLRTGVHAVLVMANSFTAWEQRLFVPGGKASMVKAELQR
ncbi:MAG TPA: PEGA domain-containing protein [Blastocatellia bacterium]|nr:PEGA domain-containing protein [Blastocatellia bacterium]HMV87398.1 PEGA domain-containing protein [Blastocatellia bacterium]HMX27149.1 PEGA domain-containing protein [Blastocatellia bacterium]HMY73028.1 PEGA domain-containing protein [Blastocatellia bacterium]HMZ16633.1 PEGA domain-containing protein [Blastocatellia bacterium]